MRKTILLIFLIAALNAIAQPMTFQNIGLQQGLSNGFVLDMAMDKQGLLWVATEYGLNRVAGNKVSVFKTSNSNISKNECTGLYYDRTSNSVWIHYKEGQLDVFNCNTQRLSPFDKQEGKYPKSVADVSGAADGGVWLGYYGGTIQHFNPKTKKFVTLSNNLFPKAKIGLRCVFDDGQDHLFIGLRMSGLYVYNLRTKRIQFFQHRDDDPTSLPGNNVRTVFVDHLKNIWIGTNNGLALFNINTGKFRVFRHSDTDPYSLASDNIHGITELRNHQLWIASDVGGIGILDLNKFSNPAFGTVAFSKLVRENSGLSSDNTRKVIQDDFGNIWIGNYSTGVDFIPSTETVFHTLSFNGKPVENVLAVCFDHNGKLWIGQDNKICQFNGDKTMKSWDFSKFLTTYSGSVYIIEEDSKGRLWLGTNDNGVLIFDPKTQTFYRFPLGQQLDIHAIYEDSRGKIWLGSENGLFSSYKGVNRWEKSMNDQMDKHSPTTAYSITEDLQGKIWVGCNDKGVFVFNSNGKVVAHLDEKHHLPSRLVNHVFRDADGGMWIATSRGLAYVQDTSKPYNMKVYGEKQDLKEDHLRAIVQDRIGNIWVSTFSGISCLDIHRQKFYNYDYKSGIPTGNFVENSAAIAPDGELYFGSPGGVCVFNPQLLSIQRKVSPVEIIDCERLGSASQQSLETIIPYNDKGIIRLDHDDNTFKFAFTVKDYSQVGDVEYSYQMKGLDDRWYDTDGDDEVTFRNLAPGSYTFTIRAKLRNQEWKDATTAEAKVVILPPFWLTWWAKVIYVILIIAMIWVIFRTYKRQLMLRNSLAQTRWENEQKQRLNEERVQFFTNITHELRTPLTLILGPIDDIAGDSRLPEIFRKKVNGIKASAERLLSLINDLLEFRKTDTQNRKLSVARDDLGAFVKEIGMRYHDLNTNKYVEIKVEIDPHVAPLYFDSEVITTVINNFMSNALKYTPKGCIILSLKYLAQNATSSIPLQDAALVAVRNTSDHHLVEIAVTDTGYGISAKALPHIFDRFYQAGDLHQASGTGIGLALVKSLAKLHEAQLTVDSKEGKGSRFAFILDAANTYPNALHKEDFRSTEDRSTEDLQMAKLPNSSSKFGLNPLADSQSEAQEPPLLLIVEDNADIRQYIADSLSNDFRIEQAANGREGRDKAFDFIPDIIVSDIMMPEMDGIEMTKALKQDIRTSHIPIILLTAKTGNDNQLEGYDSGADSYLTKPFSTRLLQGRIRNLLASRRRLAEYLAQKNLSEFGNITPISNNDRKTKNEEEEGVNYNTDNGMLHSLPDGEGWGGSPLDQKFLSSLDDLIEKNMSTETLDIAFFTDKLFMSHSTLYRKVKALTGMNINEYVRKAKLRKALTLLQSGKHNVTEVASLTGFNNLGNFRESFKREFGILPSEVRKEK